MILPKNWDNSGFFSLYLNKKLKFNQIIKIVEKFNSFGEFSKSKNDIFDEDFGFNIRNLELSINNERMQEIIQNCSSKNINMITYWDENYPTLLRNISSPPILLFVDGDFNVNDINLLSVVGTRTNTLYGKLTTEKFVEYFVNNSIEIVSGLAFGIDSIAHKKACELKSKTYAIVASGLDMLSSEYSENMAKKIKDNGGAIISEYPCGTPAQRGYFPVRNRIISGISRATLVVESGIKSGSLITARFAFEQDREVYAIPGNINSDKSKGCNYLIKNNQATLCTDPEQILIDLGWKFEIEQNEPSELIFKNEIEKKIYSVINHEPIQIDVIADKTELDIPQVMINLLNLEFKGIIKQLPGKNFIKV